MSKGKNAATKPSPADAVLTAVEANPGAATDGIASSAGVACSTASKALAVLADASKVVRHEGGRDKGKRLPDRWTVAGVEMPAAYAAHVNSPAENESSARASASKPTGKASGKPAGAKAAGRKGEPSGKPSGKPAGAKAATAAKGKPSAGKGSAAATKPAAAGAGEPAGKPPERLKAFGLDPLVLAYVEEHADSAPHGPAAVAKAIERSSGAVANCMRRLAEKHQLRQVSDKPVRYDKIAA
jgi:hypothetical protein